ncbi:MAG: enhancer of mRNA decapping [Vezdaea aestivalis]|nr:MAG: enhancer of mRNA decapping [Vezdaea aestivalis]
MAEQFIGSKVNVHLRDGSKLYGIVSKIDGSVLSLQNVNWPATGNNQDLLLIDASQIADLGIDAASTAITPKDSSVKTQIPRVPVSKESGATYYQQIYTNHYTPAKPTLSQSTGAVPGKPTSLRSGLASDAPVLQSDSSFTDPAIVSFTRNTPSQDRGRTIHKIPQRAASQALRPSVPNVKVSYSEPIQAPSTGTLQDAVNALNLKAQSKIMEPVELEVSDDHSLPPSAHVATERHHVLQKITNRKASLEEAKRNGYTGKRSRRGKRNKEFTEHEGSQVQDIIPNPSPKPTPTPRKTKQSQVSQKSGWRQGNFMESTEPSVNRVPAGKKGRHRRQLTLGEEQDGWATEEATDIQTMGDFDFEGNLSKFDKKSVFNQLRADDTTASELRLHSHNRSVAPKPGTAGGKNLHYTENVLDGPNMIAETSEDEKRLHIRSGSGRSSARDFSRQSHGQIPSRKGSTLVGNTPTTAGTAASFHNMNRAQTVSSHAMSPRVGGRSQSHSASPYPPPGPTSGSRSSLRVVPSNRQCGVVNPLQMLDIERIMESEIGLSEDMMTENAARGVAAVVLASLFPDKQGRSFADLNNSRPLVVILTGNQRSGSRAIAAGRHLRNHGVQVMACVVGLERESEFLESFRRQLKIFRNTHGKVVKFEQLAPSLSKMDSPPTVIIDSILGTTVAFEDLRVDDQASAFELIRWANKSEATVLSLDAPTGIDASTGELSELEGNPLRMAANVVVALGAPKRGILNACIEGEGAGWKIYVVDIGISNAAWRKYGTRRRYGVDFGSDWVVELRYQGGLE